MGFTERRRRRQYAELNWPMIAVLDVNATELEWAKRDGLTDDEATTRAGNISMPVIEEMGRERLSKAYFEAAVEVGMEDVERMSELALERSGYLSVRTRLFPSMEDVESSAFSEAALGRMWRPIRGPLAKRTGQVSTKCPHCVHTTPISG